MTKILNLAIKDILVATYFNFFQTD